MEPFEKGSGLNILVEDNIRTLELPRNRLIPPVVIILTGIPASGKSFLVQSLVRVLPLAILSEEEMLRFLAPKITFFKRAQEQIIVLAMKSIEKLVQRGISVVFDYNLKKKHDRFLIKQSVESAGGRFILIHIDISKEEAYKQVSKANYEVTRGEKKGVILNKDLFEYEVADTMFPIGKERALIYKPEDPDGLDIIIEQVSGLAKASPA